MEYCEKCEKRYDPNHGGCDCPNLGESTEAVCCINTRSDAIEECARWLDSEADRMEEAWNKHIASGAGGTATTYHTIPREYAKKIRALI